MKPVEHIPIEVLPDAVVVMQRQTEVREDSVVNRSCVEVHGIRPDTDQTHAQKPFEVRENFIADVVTRRDTRMLVDKLELQPDSHPQYTRTNGPPIGGLVGLGIFTVSRWLG
jgi:hypothetical protein